MPGKISGPIHTLGVLTGGGDVPGLNAAIKALVYRAEPMGIRIVGLRRFPGLQPRRSRHLAGKLPDALE